MKTEKLQFRGQAEAINRYKSVHLEHICKWGQLLLLELLKGAPARKRCCSNGIRACGNFINSTPVVKMTLMDLYRSSSAKFFTDPTQFRKNP